jgi:hypothetical protein
LADGFFAAGFRFTRKPLGSENCSIALSPVSPVSSEIPKKSLGMGLNLRATCGSLQAEDTRS